MKPNSKHFISTLLIFTLVFSLLVIPLTVIAENNSDPYYGDILLDEYIEENYNGKITVTIASSRMVANSRLAIDLNAMLPGHTFIRLDFGGGDVTVTGYTAVNTMSIQEIMNNTTVEGMLKDESTREWNAAIVYEITLEQANKIKDYIDGFVDENFNIISNNCTTFAVNALAAADIAPPTGERYWTLPSRGEIIAALPFFIFDKEVLANELLSKVYYGYTPADSVQDFKTHADCVLKYDGVIHRP